MRIQNVAVSERTHQIACTDPVISDIADTFTLFLGAGGGSPAASRIQLSDMLRAGHKMRVVDAACLKPDANIYWGGHMGVRPIHLELVSVGANVRLPPL